MSEKEMSEEERQKLEEEEKAKAWLFGQDYAKRHFDKAAYEEAQKRYTAEAEAKELVEMMEDTERIMGDMDKGMDKKIRKKIDELRKAEKESQ